ncbi:MAG: hypothetical protein DRI65_13600 [Chloroflexota bacterium]|nr:MAG: hypothetical protein DRI65_13600 [Chloroflexota bacterium]
MSNYNFTVVDGNGKDIINVDDIRVARQGIEELSKGAWIRYNKGGIEDYMDCVEAKETIEHNKSAIDILNCELYEAKQNKVDQITISDIQYNIDYHDAIIDTNRSIAHQLGVC